MRYFLAIAREQSITRAAETLHVTQSTLSKQMMELESRLGCRLLVRGNRSVTLTEEGEFLRKQAQEIIELMDKTESAFSSPEELVAGDLYLGCAETRHMREFAGLFRAIHAEYPAVRLRIFSGDAETVMERLDKGLLDIGILLDPAVYERYEYTRLPYRDEFGLLMPKGDRLARKKAVTMDDLIGLPLLVSQQTHHGSSRSQWFGRRYEQLTVVGTYNLLYNATHLVEQGVGYAFCLDGLTDTESRDLTFRPMTPPLEEGLWALTKKYQPLAPAAKVFLERLSGTRR